MRASIHRLRVIGFIEGVSFLLLMGIAMPLKYIWDKPQAVTVVGWAHGVLFVTLCLCLLQAMRLASWPMSRGALVFGAALVPFGPFLIDGKLRAEQESAPH